LAGTHTPFWQIWPTGHVAQFSVPPQPSLIVPQAPAGHVVNGTHPTHLPLLHVAPWEQTLPQAPQLFGSLVKFTQPEGQRTVPAGQVQAPLTHVAPPRQTRWQPPQLFGSVKRLVSHPFA
jgi:hypothetical protein